MSLRVLLVLGALSSGVAVASPPPYIGGPVQSVGEEQPFSWSVVPVVLEPGAEGRVTLTLTVPDGTVVYRDQLEVQVIDGGALAFGAADFPPGRIKPDPAGDVLREQYDRDVVVYLPVTAPADAEGVVPVTLQLRHQGCRGRLCYPPRVTEERVIVPVRGDEAPAPE